MGARRRARTARRRARGAPAPCPRRPTRRVVVAGLALGAIGYAAQAGLFFSALRHIDASLTSLLLYTYPALVFCGAVALRREHVTPWKALALALASAGAALVLLGGGTGGLEATGVALALGAGATYAIYILVAEGVVARIDAFLLGALITTGAAATFLLAGVVGGALTFPAGGWIWIVAIALFSTVLPVVTFMLGMERVGAATASILSTVEPVVTVGLAVALYGEALGPLQVLGGGLVLAAVVALQARATRGRAPGGRFCACRSRSRRRCCPSSRGRVRACPRVTAGPTSPSGTAFARSSSSTATRPTCSRATASRCRATSPS